MTEIRDSAHGLVKASENDRMCCCVTLRDGPGAKEREIGGKLIVKH